MTVKSVNDPAIYPKVFCIDRRDAVVVDEMTATVTFVASGERVIKRAHYSRNGMYLVDVDYSSSDSIVFVGDNKTLSFEFICDSSTLSSSRFTVKSWINESSYRSFVSNEVMTFRQSPWPVASTKVLFYSSSSMKQFSPVFVSEIPYYPSVIANIEFSTDYNIGKSVTQAFVSPGQTVSREVIDAGDYGVLNAKITLSAFWYYDSNRTLLVETPPEDLASEMPDKTFVSRLFFVASGKFFFMGGVGQDGVAMFDGVLTQNYVLSNSLDYGSLHFVGLNDDSGLLFVESEDEVIVDGNGYCVKEGQLSHTYFV
jgi:hypothetical protein